MDWKREKVKWYFLGPKNRFLFNKIFHICPIKKFYFINRGLFLSPKLKNRFYFKSKSAKLNKFQHKMCKVIMIVID